MATTKRLRLHRASSLPPQQSYQAGEREREQESERGRGREGDPVSLALWLLPLNAQSPLTVAGWNGQMDSLLTATPLRVRTSICLTIKVEEESQRIFSPEEKKRRR